MGPVATSQLYNKIISIFQEKYNAKYDKDFPEIIIVSLPIPNIVGKIENEELAIAMLINAVKRLEKAGSSFIVIPCNTIHAYIETLRQSIKIPILSIMEEVIALLKEKNFLNVGLFSTEFTLKANLYSEGLNRIGVNLIKLNYKKQKLLTKLIMEILSGKLTQANKKILLNLINDIKNRGAEIIILGCTELPLLINQDDCDIELINTIEVLAQASVRESIKTYINKNKEIV